MDWNAINYTGHKWEILSLLKDIRKLNLSFKRINLYIVICLTNEITDNTGKKTYNAMNIQIVKIYKISIVI